MAGEEFNCQRTPANSKRSSKNEMSKVSGGKLTRLPQERSTKRDGTQIATLAVAMRFVAAFLSPA